MRSLIFIYSSPFHRQFGEMAPNFQRSISYRDGQDGDGNGANSSVENKSAEGTDGLVG